MNDALTVSVCRLPVRARHSLYRRSALATATLAVGLLASTSTQAAFLTPIAGYGTGGIATFTAGEGYTLSEREPGGIVAAAAAASDGSLYVMYRAVPSTDSTSHFVIVRLGPTGLLDSSFTRLDLGSTAGVDDNVALALDEADQRLYFITLPPTVAADSITVSARRFDGSRDPAFNTGSDVVIVPGRSIENRYSLAAKVIAGSGRLVLTGAFLTDSVPTSPETALGNLQPVTYVLTPAGQLDTTFNSSGLKIQVPSAASGLTSALAFGAATGASNGRIFNFGSGKLSSSRFVGTVFVDNADGSTDTTFGGDGLSLVDVSPTDTPASGQAYLTQLLFGRSLPSGVTQFVGLTGRIDLSTLRYISGTTSVAGVQLTSDGAPDTRFNGTGVNVTPYELNNAPPTVLFANGSFASVYRQTATSINVLAVEGFSGFTEDGGSTTGGSTTGGTTGGSTTGGTTGGTTTGGTTTGGTTTGGTTPPVSGGGGGSFGLLGLAGLMVGALLRRRRGFSVLRGN